MSDNIPAPTPGSSVGKWDWKHDGLKLIKVAAAAAGGAALTVIASDIDQLQALHPTIWWTVPLAVLVRAAMAFFADTRPSTAVKVLVGMGFIGALLASSPASAAEKTVRDNLGHRYGVDAKTQLTPGAGSGLGALIGDAVDTSAIFVQHDWDVSITTGATGSNNDSGQEEAMLLGLGVWKYVAKNAAIGIEVLRPDVAVPEVIAIQPTARLYIGWNPTSSFTKGVKASIFRWEQAVGDNDRLEGGAFSLMPTLIPYLEFPMKEMALQVGAGVRDVMTEQSIDIQDRIEIAAELTLLWRAIR